jgi:hypothetical protein
MSIESNLESIAKSLSVIAANWTQLPLPLPMHSPAPAPAAAPVPMPIPAPAAAPVPAPAPVPMPTPMPVPAPVPAPAAASAPAAPFTDAAGLMAYIKDKYRALGPIKGALIQNVLTEVGCRNVNDVTPGNYGLFYQKVEALS